MPLQSVRRSARPVVGAFGGQIFRESLSQQAYTAIRSSLMRSRLEPGQKLVTRQVADELGISVTPVRESLLRLVSEHALELDERGTVTVPELTLERCLEIRDLRMLNEGESAARAASSITDSDIDQLEQIHARFVAATKDKEFGTALEENENFHFALCRLAGSPVLFDIVENLWMQFGPLLTYLFDGGPPPFHGETHGHDLVIEALRRRDPEAARSAIKQDILVGGKTVIERLSKTRAAAA